MLLQQEELNTLKTAKTLLENPGIAIKLSNIIENPVENSKNTLPKNWNKQLLKITQTSILKASNEAIFTIKNMEDYNNQRNLLHKNTNETTNDFDGLFDINGLTIELTATTTFLLSSIADIASFNGEFPNDLTTKFACLEVLALGHNNIDDKNLESKYYLTRSLLSNSMSLAKNYIIENGINYEATEITHMITMIAERFSSQVTKKSVLKSAPIMSAVAGAINNTIFISHFQDIAKGHFIIRKLERKYGQKHVQQFYNRI